MWAGLLPAPPPFHQTVMSAKQVELQEPLSARVRRKRDGDHLHQLTSDSRRQKEAKDDRSQDLQ